MDEQSFYEALQTVSTKLGRTRGHVVTTSAWAAIARDLNRLSLVADEHYQTMRERGE